MTTTAAEETTEQIRGSSLLMSGRVITLVANLVVQVLTVRYLSKSDFGAFAYAMSFTTAARIVVTLGHSRVITRFLAIYEERREYERLFGTLLMEGVIVLSVGTATILGMWFSRGWLTTAVAGDALAVQVLLIVILLAPVEALEDLAEGMFAVFAKARAIFFRRYILNPALKLSVVVTLIATGRGVVFLAAGYVVATTAGVLFYGSGLLRALRERGISQHFSLRSARAPVRDVFRFSVPLLSGELVIISINTVSVMMLGYFAGMTAVAGLRAIRPAALLNHFVMRAFQLLFLPHASRLYARGDREGLNQAYWHTAVWLGLCTFPVFLMTFVFSEQLTVLLFGERYRDSAPLLAVLSLGYFLNVCLGFNAVILQVVGRLRHLVVVNFTAAALDIALAMVLVPRYGAMGVAIAGCVALTVQNLMNQAGLRGVGVGIVPVEQARAYLSMALTAAVLWGFEAMFEPGIATSIPLAATGSLTVLYANRHVLRIAETYPKLLRLPVVGRLLSPPAPAPAE